MGSKVTDVSSQSRAADSQLPENDLFSPGASRWSRGFVLLCFAVVAALVLLRAEVLPLGAVRPELSKDHGLLTWSFWAVTESTLRGESPYETRLLFHPLGSNLTAHTLGPGFLPIGLAAKLARGGAADYPLYARRVSILVCFALGTLLGWLDRVDRDLRGLDDQDVQAG